VTEPGRAAIADDYAWLDSTWLTIGFCVTYARGLSEREALLRFGADETTLGPMTAEEAIEIDLEHGGGGCFVALAQTVGDWAVVLEPNGWLGQELEAKSAGTTAVSVYLGGHGVTGFTYARDGEHLTSFEPLFPDHRSGSQPDLVAPHLLAVGLDESLGEERYGTITEGSLALAERLSGVRLTAAMLDGPWLGGRIPRG
jgi:hypothetical protein